MRRRQGLVDLARVIRLLILLAVLTIPLLAGRLIQHLGGEAPIRAEAAGRS
jgi:hypothetical protein